MVVCVRLAAAAPNQPDLSGSAFGLEAEPRSFGIETQGITLQTMNGLEVLISWVSQG